MLSDDCTHLYLRRNRCCVSGLQSFIQATRGSAQATVDYTALRDLLRAGLTDPTAEPTLDLTLAVGPAKTPKTGRTKAQAKPMTKTQTKPKATAEPKTKAHAEAKAASAAAEPKAAAKAKSQPKAKPQPKAAKQQISAAIPASSPGTRRSSRSRHQPQRLIDEYSAQ